MTFVEDVFPEIPASKKYAWLNVLKAVLQRTVRQKTRQMGLNTVTI